MAAWFEIRSALLAVRLLSRRLGAAATGRMVWQLKRRAGRGEPWTALPPPSSPQQAECRRQAGEVILLYRLAGELIGGDEALALVAEIVRESAVLQLRGVIPRLARQDFDAMAQSERRAFLEEIVARFPNATVENLVVDDERFAYDITRCWFVDLTAAAGHAELAPLFCAGDGLFFARDLPEVSFDRPETLAEGAPRCAFRFRWQDEAEVIPIGRRPRRG